MPDGQVRGEEEAGEGRVPEIGAVDFSLGVAYGFALEQQPHDGLREEKAIEGGGDGAGFAQTDENWGEADAGGADHQRGGASGVETMRRLHSILWRKIFPPAKTSARSSR